MPNLLVSKTFKQGWNASFGGITFRGRLAPRRSDQVPRPARLETGKTFNIGARAAKAELIVHNLLNDYPEFEDF